MIDLTGQKFERLVIVQRMDNDKYGNLRWLCLCYCGKEIIIRGDSLKSGNTKSCGCLKKEGNNFKHGHSTKNKTSKTYNSWYGMIQRCANPNTINYKDYGGNGTIVCKRWLKFENFLEDMGEVPIGKSIDREDNHKAYCKENCRWSTRKEQQRNRRNNRLITFNGKIQCISAWSEEYNICPYVLRSRLNIGWSIKKSLNTPVKRKSVS